MPPRFTYSPLPAGIPIVLGAAAGLLLRLATQPNHAHPLGLFTEDDAADPEPADQEGLTIPTDLFLAGWRGLFPAERMMLICGRRSPAGLVASSIRDVTSQNTSTTRVVGCPELLARALLDFEISGGRLVGWLHSHPGTGALATHPSIIDKRQDEDLRRDFGDQIVGLIATRDGFLRLWGQAIDEGTAPVQFQGNGIGLVEKENHVYRLAF